MYSPHPMHTRIWQAAIIGEKPGFIKTPTFEHDIVFKNLNLT